MSDAVKINSLLIANRGEIARRIIRTCRRMGIRAVAVYSDADAGSAHVVEADAAVHIGASPPAASYLNIAAVLDAARRAGVAAVHPGFGFLAENADFARACAAAGLVFVGPAVEAIAAMGDKRAARDLAERCGVPVIPGFDGGDQSDGAFGRAAAQFGYPVMIKAAGGGGGKGMRLTRAPGDLPEALAAARREAAAAFGSGDLLLERALERPRHVEMQVLGDTHGHIIHLGERECSIQRRHQKVIEESPSPAVTPAQREEMGVAAVRLAGSIDYSGAGTVEFLLHDDRFYFLEMNTRLQVEHPVTELVTGIDLVEWQIRVAGGEALPWRQSDIMPRGHAIEARLYAEDPANDFLPATGPVLLWRAPEGEGVRVDAGIRDGDRITTNYDPMLAKIIARGETRSDAIRRLRDALQKAVLHGLTSNLSFLIDVVQDPAFVAGETHTGLLDGFHSASERYAVDDLRAALVVAALARYQADAGDGPGYWRNNPGLPAPYRFESAGQLAEVRLVPVPRRIGEFVAHLSSGDALSVTLVDYRPPEITLLLEGIRRRFVLSVREADYWIQTPGGAVRLEARPILAEPRPAAGAGGSLRAPMPGRVLAVLVEVGQRVEAGRPLMKIEAMKMEHTIRSAADGVVEAVYFSAGDQVGADDLLMRIIDG